MKRFFVHFFVVTFWIFGSGALADLADDLEDVKDPTPSTKTSSPPSNSLQTNESKQTTPSEVKTKPQPKNPGESRQTSQKQSKKSTKVGIVKFWSKALSGFRDQGFMILEEDVVVTQDDLRLEADKATIYFEKSTNEVKEVHAVGSVKLNKTDQESGLPIRAEGREAFFDNKKRTVTLKGDPVLHRGEDTVRGKVINYDLTNGWVKADRVEGVVLPSNKKGEPKK